MRTRSFGLLILATALYGQSAGDVVGDVQTVARITSDLVPLKSTLISSEPLKDEPYTPAELQSLVTYSQHKIIQAYQRDLMGVGRRQRRTPPRFGEAPASFRSFFSTDHAYKLTSSLAGKDLSEENLTPLVEGIVGMAESAAECSETSSPLQSSALFRSSAGKVVTALQVLGVSNADARVVADALFRDAKAASAPPVRVTYK